MVQELTGYGPVRTTIRRDWTDEPESFDGPVVAYITVYNKNIHELLFVDGWKDIERLVIPGTDLNFISRGFSESTLIAGAYMSGDTPFMLYHDLTAVVFPIVDDHAD